MDAFTAIGLAGNIVQFVDFSWKLIAGCRVIYKSSEGASDETLTLGSIANDVVRLSNAIGVSSYDDQLEPMAKECTAIAKELSDALNKLTAKSQRTMWISFSIALKEVWRKGKIEGICNRLGKVQAQLAVHIQRLEIERKDDFNKLREDVIRAITSLSSAKGSAKTSMQECFDQQQRSEEVDAEKATEVTIGLKNLSAAMSNLTEMGKTTQVEQQFLKSLHFANLVTRHEKIEKSHEETFTWMFRNSLEQGRMPLRFSEWLRSRSGIYWIEGKAGSGKSTLMKFLCKNPMTMSHLESWAQGKRLVVAQFFFWNAGTRLQKSREGLLRSLLFEILRKCPDLLSKVIENVGVPEFADEEESWCEDDLLRIYRVIMSQETPIRFCFFIDGLDEYEDDNKGPEELLDTLRSIDCSSNTKLCVSSRPWVIFRDEFGKTPEWHIRLEDLTRDDIRSFVSFKFNKNEQFQKLKERDPRYPKLIEDVVERARGVFLWVRLVVRSLLEGLTYHDSVATLSRRLNSFPEDLDDFFQHMIDSIPTIYRIQTARTFKIATEAKQPQLLMTYSFVDGLEEDREYCFKLPIAPMALPEIETRAEQMERRLDGRCRGLLEIVEDRECTAFDKYKIDFLHRTVRDFLLQS
ncbi:uncharacterized protein BDR25DRAFT_241210, partial [Lindgomyces ingoldianus]